MFSDMNETETTIQYIIIIPITFHTHTPQF